MTEPYYTDDHVTLHNGDCLDVMRTIPDASIDAIVTDPPYGLSEIGQRALTDVLTAWIAGDRAATPKGSGFMGKSWDAFVPPPAVWDEAYRVLKPGGHLLAFAGSRTDDLMGLSIRLAGFEIRDSIAWMYGSGFPKSLDVSKAIDREFDRGLDRELEFTAWVRSTGVTAKQINDITGTQMGSHYTTARSQPAIPTAQLLDVMRPILPAIPQWIEDEVAERERRKAESAERNEGKGKGFLESLGPDRVEYQPREDAAQQWEGWGTALKPAFEPVVVARKPLVGTVAANVIQYGTGALNIDASRIAGELWMFKHGPKTGRTGGIKGEPMAREGVAQSHPAGRFPANVILDESQADVLDEQSGQSQSRIGSPRGAASGDGWGMTETGAEYDDLGGASRFFYVAKADSGERPKVDGIAHPTVKPLDLMRYLVRLVTPPGGVILEPFAGSGTTLEAATLEGFRSVGIEREADYLPLIRQRLNRRRDPVEYLRSAGDDLGLFDALDFGVA